MTLLSVVMVFRIRDPQFSELWNITTRSINGMLETANQRFEFIVIDNGSHDESYIRALDASSRLWKQMPHFTRNLEGVRLLRFEEPISLSRAWNEGINQADGDFILVANNDIVYHESGWMSRMLEPFSWEDRKIGIVGIQHMSWYKWAFTEGSLYVFPKSFKEEFNLTPEVDFVRILDERFTLSCEDVDFNYRVQQAGYETIQVDGPALQPRWLQHLGHRTIQTLAGTDESFIALTHENRIRLCEKWGVEPQVND